MARKNMFEILKENYNILQEMDKIVFLFRKELFRYGRTSYTIENLFNEKFLPYWKNRGSCLSCSEIKSKLKLTDEFYTTTPIEDYVSIIEYYENLIYPICSAMQSIRNQGWNIEKEFNILIENIKIFLDHINYEHKIFKDEEMVLILPKNPAATAVAEISSEETALAILMYNHLSLKGDLEQKRNLLNSIYREYEPLFTSSLEGYNDFLNKTNALFNNLHIRHNNKTKKDNKNTIINLDEKELEKWYDELYQLLLFCILIKDNLERKSHVDEFLKSIKGAKA